MKIDGINLTADQLEKCRAVALHPDVTKARKVITLYKYEDANLAMFRVQAASYVEAITVRAVLNKPLKAAQAAFVNRWLVDQNPMFAEFFTVLNRTVGRAFIQGAPL
jgi:hypothetical protein